MLKLGPLSQKSISEYVRRKKREFESREDKLPEIERDARAFYAFPDSWHDNENIYLDRQLAKETSNDILLFLNINAAKRVSNLVQGLI